MIARQVSAVVTLVACATGNASSHHSLTEYDSARRVTLNAVVREFHFVNPHPFLLVDAASAGSGVRGDASPTRTWRLELDNRFELVDIGMTPRTFTRGDQLIVTGAPGRDDQAILYVRELDRPGDRFRYEQVGNTPRIVRPSGSGRQR